MKNTIGIVLVVMFSIVQGMAQNSALTFEKVGTGKHNIIFISGLASPSSVWNESVAELQSNSTCYKLDINGFVQNLKNKIIKAEQIATAIAGWIRAQNIEKPILIGHSLGGAVALAICADNPKLIFRVIIIDAYPSLSALMNAKFKAEENKDCRAFINQFTNLTSEQFEAMMKPNIAQMVIDSDKQNEVLKWVLAFDRNIYANLLCNYSNFDYREKVKNIEIPTLVLVGSKLVPFKSSIEEQYESIKDCTLEYSDKGRHFLMYDDYDWYIEKVKNFVE